jgi:molybdate transport system regulatory protein
MAEKAPARLSLRIDLENGKRIGPGKIALLELVATHGSISAAGRALDMSYRRAWELIDELNGIFGAPVVETSTGGRHGGGAALTPLGRSVIDRYRAIERAAQQAAQAEINALAKDLRTR